MVDDGTLALRGGAKEDRSPEDSLERADKATTPSLR